jgi:hypothetical protein|tara:strand:+ start:2747 stop:2947 length:201 start_codon:yes stop_codon:yes gene_type:complete
MIQKMEVILKDGWIAFKGKGFVNNDKRVIDTFNEEEEVTGFIPFEAILKVNFDKTSQKRSGGYIAK